MRRPHWESLFYYLDDSDHPFTSGRHDFCGYRIIGLQGETAKLLHLPVLAALVLVENSAVILAFVSLDGNFFLCRFHLA